MNYFGKPTKLALKIWQTTLKLKETETWRQTS